MAKAVHDLAGGNVGIAQATQEQTRVAFSNAQLDALFDLQKLNAPAPETDLLAVGVAAIGALVGGILFRS